MNPIENIIKRIKELANTDGVDVKKLDDKSIGYIECIDDCVDECKEELKSFTGIYYEQLNPKKGTRYRDLIPLANAGKLCYYFNNAMQEVVIEFGNDNGLDFDFIFNKENQFSRSIGSTNDLVSTDRIRYFIKVDMNEKA